MSAAADIWMPCFIADEAIETAHWSRDECGAGHLLKKSYWKNGGPLIADDQRLARIAKATDEEWPRLRPTMLEIFEEVDGYWVHPRLNEEIAKAKACVAAKSAAGRRGAESRWRRDGERNGKGNGTRIADASVRQWQTDAPSPSPDISTDVDISRAQKRAGTRPRRVVGPDEPHGFPEFYEAFPLKRDRRKAATAYASAIRRGATPPKLLLGAQRYAVQRQGEDPKFTKHPTTWLNADSWLDEEIHHGSNRPTSHSKLAVSGFAAAVAARVDDRAGADVVALRDRARDLAPAAECGLQDDPGGDIENREADQSQRMRQGAA